MRTALRFLLAAFRGRALSLEGPRGRFHLFPDGTIMPAIAGADDDPPAPDPAPEPDPDPAPDPEPEPDPDPNEPKFEGPFDEEEAKRVIAHLKARRKEERGKEAAKLAAEEARRKELEQAQETEHETAKRERDEAKAEAQRQRDNANRIAIDLAVRDAAAEADVPPKKVKRLVRMVDRDEISTDADGEVEGATEAVAAFLDDFPEFKGKDPEPGEGEGGEKPPKEPGGGNPNRKGKPKSEYTAEDARKLAKDDPDKFHELMDAGKLDAALAGS